MPPRKKATKPARKTTKKPAQRKLSVSHKRALAERRSMSATVDRYLSAVNTPKRRGRKVSKAALQQRLTAATTKARSATGVDKVLAAQEVRDLQNRIAKAEAATGGDIKSLEAAFVKIARRFGENRGIGYGASGLEECRRRPHPQLISGRSDLCSSHRDFKSSAQMGVG